MRFFLLDFPSVYSAVRNGATLGSADERRPHDVLRKQERGAQGKKPHVWFLQRSIRWGGTVSEIRSTLPSL